MTPDIIDQLAESIARHTARRIPLAVDYWSAAEIAEAFNVAESQVREVFAVDPQFPKSFRLPVRGGGRGHPRWKATEVQQWAERYRDESTGKKGCCMNEAAEVFSVAALFVRQDSIYKTMTGVDCWDIDRDARMWPGDVR